VNNFLTAVIQVLEKVVNPYPRIEKEPHMKADPYYKGTPLAGSKHPNRRALQMPPQGEEKMREYFRCIIQKFEKRDALSIPNRQKNASSLE